jgi:PAS domain S-box-containing protein
MEKEIGKIIFDSIDQGVFTVDKNCIITAFNPAAEQITGFQSSEAIGKHCFDIFRADICHTRCALKDTLKKHDPINNTRVTIINREGCEIPISVSTTILRNGKDNIIGAVEFFNDVSEVEHLKKRLDFSKAREDIVSVNPVMQDLIQLLPDVAESECSVLIQGPSGVGKELFAQAIHNLSPRKYGPYIKLNCAALPATLLESELFGYVKGAFTDAKRDKPGQFCLANGGTLLLDEISEMDVALQVKLLRVLNNGEYQPLGSTQTMRTDARIIASTNADLQRDMANGRFREDLYFRINVVNLEIPPLNQRPEDIPLLVEHFIKSLKKKTRKPIEKVSPEAIRVLRKYEFPGNVRELENAIEHAFVMCHGRNIRPEHLPGKIINMAALKNGQNGYPRNERKIIEEALTRNNGNRNRVAQELGMHRSTLWRKIKTYNIGI